MVYRGLTLLLIILLIGCQRAVQATEQNVSPTPAIATVPAATKPPAQTIEALSTSPSPATHTVTPIAYISTAYPAIQLPVAEASAFPISVPTTLPPTIPPAPSLDDRTSIVQSKWDACRAEITQKGAAIGQHANLAGLVLRIEAELWKIDAQGKPVLLSCMPRSELSGSGKYVTFPEDHDFWFADLKTGQVYPVTNTPDLEPNQLIWSPNEQTIYYTEGSYSERTGQYSADQIWRYSLITGERKQLTSSEDTQQILIRVLPENPQWLVYLIFPPTLEPEPGADGYLFLLNTDNAVAHELSKNARFAFAPDGKTIVYSNEGAHWFYQPGKLPQQFRPEEFIYKDGNVIQPALLQWSPDGKSLSAVGNHTVETKNYSGVVVFDLQEKQANFFHRFQPVGSGAGGTMSIYWSPNSQWIAVATRDQEAAKAGLWIMRPDGSEEHHLGRNWGDIWSPDGQRLLFHQEDKQIWMVNTQDWKLEQVQLPEGSDFLEWK